MNKNIKIGFIGAGNIAEALIKGIIESKIVSHKNISAGEPNKKRRKELSSRVNIEILEDNSSVVEKSDIIFLAVKPNVIDLVLQEIGGLINSKQLVISIAAGISTRHIEKYFSGNIPIIRVMPNTPALVLSGISALSAGQYATQANMELAKKLLSSVGDIIQLPENLLDTVTGLSGSGPAYVFEFIEALTAGGVKEGLTKEIALKLTIQTVYGSAKMLIKTGEHPVTLRDRVTSPGGTTISGLHALESGKFRATVMNAVSAATQRSKELGQMSK